MRIDRVAMLAVWFLLTLFALGGTALMARRTALALASNRWPKISGILGSAEREKLSNEAYYETKVSYSFGFGDKRFDGHRITYRLFDGGLSYEQLKELVGRPVSIYYDPADPSRAVLVTGAGVFNFVFLLVLAGVFGALCLIGYLLFFVSPIPRRHPKGIVLPI
jgi:hypothetical protein